MPPHRPKPRRKNYRRPFTIASLTLTLGMGLALLCNNPAPAGTVASPSATGTAAANPSLDAVALQPSAAADSAAFDALDSNHDGRLSPAELTTGMADAMASGEAQHMFAHLDRNHDGWLERDEFDPDPAAVVASLPRQRH